MLTEEQVAEARQRAGAYLDRAGIVLTSAETAAIEVADFGLSELETTGLALVVYVNTDRYCAKELVLLPRQTCPEHRHPPMGSDLGKQETFRCRQGLVWLYVEGEHATGEARGPASSEAYYTVVHEITLGPGEQDTIPPNTWHWFQAGDECAIASEC